MTERTRNCLLSAKITCLLELDLYVKEHGLKSLLKIKNFGKRCLVEVESILNHRLSNEKIMQAALDILKREDEVYARYGIQKWERQ